MPPPEEERQKKPGKGACFLDQGRVCTTDCMSFLPQPPEGRAYMGENWAHCHMLVNADRGARHVAILANGVGNLLKMLEDIIADKAREYKGSTDPQ